MLVTKTSPRTGLKNTRDMDVTQEQLAELALPGNQRRLIQDIVPQLSNAEREFLMTGYTQADWDEIFGDEDESDENEVMDEDN